MNHTQSSATQLITDKTSNTPLYQNKTIKNNKSFTSRRKRKIDTQGGSVNSRIRHVNSIRNNEQGNQEQQETQGNIDITSSIREQNTKRYHEKRELQDVSKPDGQADKLQTTETPLTFNIYNDPTITYNQIYEEDAEYFYTDSILVGSGYGPIGLRGDFILFFVNFLNILKAIRIVPLSSVSDR